MVKLSELTEEQLNTMTAEEFIEQWQADPAPKKPISLGERWNIEAEQIEKEAQQREKVAEKKRK